MKVILLLQHGYVHTTQADHGLLLRGLGHGGPSKDAKPYRRGGSVWDASCNDCNDVTYATPYRRGALDGRKSSAKDLFGASDVPTEASLTRDVASPGAARKRQGSAAPATSQTSQLESPLRRLGESPYKESPHKRQGEEGVSSPMQQLAAKPLPPGFSADALGSEIM